MDFSFSEEEKKLQKEVESFLRQEVTEELVREVDAGQGYGPCTWKFLSKLGQRGWLCPHWPREYHGLGSSYMKRSIITDSIWRHRGPGRQIGAGIAGSIILRYGSEEQKRHYLPAIARGEIELALGYTEPQAGTDLASLEMRAVRQGEEYIINGQKMFSTAAHFAQYHWLLARTDPSVPKHKGLSLFIVDLKSPGITIRPLLGMADKRTNEVFYDNVHVLAKNLVGKENQGWYQVMTALEYERVNESSTALCQRLLEELVEYCRQIKNYGVPLSHDPLVRQRVAQMAIELMVGRLLTLRAVWMLDRGEKPDWQSAVAKVFNSEVKHRITSEELHILGLYGQLKPGPDNVPLVGSSQREYEQSYADMIGGGSNEILRNVIATRGLGLPTGKG